MSDTSIFNVEQMAMALYGVDGEPTKSQRNKVAELCRNGQLDAVKAGRRWLIRVEWPSDEAKRARAMEAKSRQVKPTVVGGWKNRRTVE